ncbi:MAG: hypothetical protein E7462_07420 [Ruminococcaceae bacterium]|nr:hypothetical protein [Oscillospiraceae bacterium]
MVMQIGSPVYMLSLFIAFVLLTGLFFLLKGRRKGVQKGILLGLMLLNVLQHLLKFLIYPHCYGNGFNVENTAYNMCAFLILLAPIAYGTRSAFLRDFTFYTATVAGILAIAVPIWFLGQPVKSLSWEYLRFYLCHVLLFLSGALPLMLGHHKPSWRCFPKIGLAFLLVLGLILLNDALCVLAGIFPGHTAQDLYATLRAINPCWSMGPPADGSFAFVVDVIHLFSPNIFCGENAAGLYIPLLWYAIPMYLGITLVAFGVCTLVDRRRFLQDMRLLRARRKKRARDRKKG